MLVPSKTVLRVKLPQQAAFSPSKNVRAAAAEVPVFLFVQIQALVSAGLSDAEIAQKTALDPTRVSELILTEGWRETLVDTEAQSSKDQIARDRWVRAIAAQSKWLALAGMKLAGDAADRGDAMGFSMAARGAKTFVDMARQASGLDAGANTTNSQAPGINLFVLSTVPQRVVSSEKTVLNSIETQVSVAPVQSSLALPATAKPPTPTNPDLPALGHAESEALGFE